MKTNTLLAIIIVLLTILIGKVHIERPYFVIILAFGWHNKRL